MEENVQKKGKRSWEKARPLDIMGKRPGWRYRWVKNDPGRVEQMLMQHWQVCNKTNNQPIDHEADQTALDGKHLDSSKQYRGLVLMALPPDWAEARDEFIASETDKQTVGLKRDLVEKSRNAAKEDGAKPAEFHGSIVIE